MTSFLPCQAHLGAPASDTSLLEETKGKENQAGIPMSQCWAPWHLVTPWK